MKKFSGANFCFLGIGVGRVSPGAVLPLFCFSIWFFVPEHVSRKFASGQVRFLNKFSGANFCVWQPYCHSVAFPPSRRGEMLSVFFTLCFLCPVRCLLSFFYRSSFLRVAV